MPTIFSPPSLPSSPPCESVRVIVHHLLNLTNPNTKKSYKILQRPSQKHAAHGVGQSPYLIYSHGKAYLSKQFPWCAAGNPRLAHGRSRVGAQAPAGRLCMLFSLPSLFSSFLFPTIPMKVLGFNDYILFLTKLFFGSECVKTRFPNHLTEYFQQHVRPGGLHISLVVHLYASTVVHFIMTSVLVIAACGANNEKRKNSIYEITNKYHRFPQYQTIKSKTKFLQYRKQPYDKIIPYNPRLHWNRKWCSLSPNTTNIEWWG